MDKCRRWMPMTLDPQRRLDACLARRGDAIRVLVVVAHPDDEVLGCGGLLGWLPDVRVIHVTDGAPRDGGDAGRQGFASPAAYAEARAAEARAALALAGVAPERLTGFGVPDQQASLHLAATARRLVPAMAEADLVLTHALEGGHGDHDAVAFAVHGAAGLLPRAARPALVEMPFYHAAPEGWRRQRFLPRPDAGPERDLRLDAADRDRKAQMIAAHGSQGDTLVSFDDAVERYRLAPSYDFAVRPHAGDLLYERHGWNLDWPAWVARVGAATAALGAGQAA